MKNIRPYDFTTPRRLVSLALSIPLGLFTSFSGEARAAHCGVRLTNRRPGRAKQKLFQSIARSFDYLDTVSHICVFVETISTTIIYATLFLLYRCTVIVAVIGEHCRQFDWQSRARVPSNRKLQDVRETRVCSNERTVATQIRRQIGVRLRSSGCASCLVFFHLRD